MTEIAQCLVDNPTRGRYIPYNGENFPQQYEMHGGMGYNHGHGHGHGLNTVSNVYVIEIFSNTSYTLTLTSHPNPASSLNVLFICI